MFANENEDIEKAIAEHEESKPDIVKDVTDPNSSNDNVEYEKPKSTIDGSGAEPKVETESLISTEVC